MSILQAFLVQDVSYLRKFKSIDSRLVFFSFGKRNSTNILMYMYVCTTVVYEYMKSLWIDGSNMHVWSIIYQEFYYGIVYIWHWRTS